MFYWKAQADIFSKSLFNWSGNTLISLTKEKIDVLSGNGNINRKINRKITISIGRLQPNDAYIFKTIEISWFLHESDCRKPDWFSQKKLFFYKYSIIELNKIFSIIFPRIGNKEIGQ